MFDKTARSLVGMFQKNFAKFESVVRRPKSALPRPTSDLQARGERVIAPVKATHPFENDEGGREWSPFSLLRCAVRSSPRSKQTSWRAAPAAPPPQDAS